MDERTHRLPDGPKSKVLATLRYLRDPVGSIVDLGRRHGDLFTIPNLAGPIVVAAAPSAIRAIFAAEPDTFAPFAADSMAPVLGRGSILIQHGAAHRRARKLMQPPFHGARMRAYGATMRDSSHAHLAARPLGRPFPVEDVFRDISLDVIIRTIFGVATGERIAACRRGVRESIAAFGPLLATFTSLQREFGGWGPWARFRRLLTGVHDLLRQEIAARDPARPGDDILSLLVAARDESGAAMDEQEIVEQLFTMVIAGHETTATALAWAIDEMLRQPELLGQLREELRPIGVDPDRLAQSPLLDAVCAETLRLHPLIPLVTRKLLRPFEVGGHALPEGVGLGACLLLAHLREERYPQATAFRPQRFLAGKQPSPHEYLPFGGGARRCLGAAFALHEMKIVLATVLLEFELELTTAPARTSVRAATIGPRGGVPVVRRR
ncbi:cytochrome P450 [Nannocystis radixulma]|uniref:Cytochrome P450 n=1 Tax=Nannocystis radixulma TaxID=2995305 RepID=A0ABT5B5J5_9BACT|nr:cytochrome P450 [Nannocystis radixulma]MDC0668331.1 cytochrome P450 [Nannocystis radixulma]